MVRYEPDVLWEYADRLYQEAQRVTLKRTLAGLAVGALIWIALSLPALGGRVDDPVRAVLGFAATAGGSLIGIWSGQARALWLKLEAQRLLVVVQIEQNTRRETGAS